MGITLDEVRALDANTDNIAISDGTDTLAINGDGSINATVTATDFDIRDLVHTQDSVDLGDGTSTWDLQTLDAAFNDAGVSVGIAGVRQDASGSPVSADGDAHPLVFNDMGELKVAAALSSSVADDTADAENPIKVGGRAQDQGSALTQVSAANDRFDLTGDLYRRLHINQAFNVGWQVTTATVGTSEAELAGTPLDGRKSVIIQNVSNNRDVYVRGVTGVSTSNGICIPALASMEFMLGESLNIFAIADGAGADVRIVEAA